MIRSAQSNPFRTAALDQLTYYSPDTCILTLAEDFQRLANRAMLVGPHGSGKSTLLADIASALSSRYSIKQITLREEKRIFSSQDKALLESLSNGDLLLVDGFEQLSAWNKFRLMRCSLAAGGLLLTSHRPGPLPILHSHSNCFDTTVLLVEKLLQKKLDAKMHEQLRPIYKFHGNDTRSILFELYDLWSESKWDSNSLLV